MQEEFLHEEYVMDEEEADTDDMGSEDEEETDGDDADSEDEEM